MKYKNIFFLMALAICTIITITSCGDDEPEYDDNTNSDSSFNLAKGDLSGWWVDADLYVKGGDYYEAVLFGKDLFFDGSVADSHGDNNKIPAFGKWFGGGRCEGTYYVKDNKVSITEKDTGKPFYFSYRLEEGKLIKYYYNKYDDCDVDIVTYVRADDSSKSAKLAGTTWKGKEDVGYDEITVRFLDKHIVEITTIEANGDTEINFELYSYDEKTGIIDSKYHHIFIRGTVEGKTMRFIGHTLRKQ